MMEDVCCGLCDYLVLGGLLGRKELPCCMMDRGDRKRWALYNYPVEWWEEVCCALYNYLVE